jgi:hypothetical protein
MHFKGYIILFINLFAFIFLLSACHGDGSDNQELSKNSTTTSNSYDELSTNNELKSLKVNQKSL